MWYTTHRHKYNRCEMSISPRSSQTCQPHRKEKSIKTNTTTNTYRNSMFQYTHVHVKYKTNTVCGCERWVLETFVFHDYKIYCNRWEKSEEHIVMHSMCWLFLKKIDCDTLIFVWFITVGAIRSTQCFVINIHQWPVFVFYANSIRRYKKRKQDTIRDSFISGARFI